MASAIHQLIAQSRGPDIMGAMARGTQVAGMMQDIKARPAQMRLMELQKEQVQQNLAKGQSEMARADKEAAEQEQIKGMRFAADMGRVLSKVPDEQRAQVYAQLKQEYEQENPMARPLPEQYNPSVQRVLDFAVQRVYGGEMMKHDQALELEGVRQEGRQRQGSEDPSNIREWAAYQAMSPGDRAEYLRMKRADPTFKMGDVTMRGNQVTGEAEVFGAPGQTQADVQDTLSSQAAQSTAKQENVKAATKLADESFSRLEKVRTNIANYQEAIDLIDAGAQTGVVMSRLPSIRQASIALDNLQGRLGLDVIGNTTFGALSEAELRFALDTALPKNMEGPALKSWLMEKKASQEKLASYLEQATLFLGTPGNTVKDWVEFQKATQQEMAPTPSGSPLPQPSPQLPEGFKILGFE